MKILDTYLTGSISCKEYSFVMKHIRRWCDELAPGDMIAIRCEGAMADKKYEVWGKWFLKREQQHAWKQNPQFNCFTFYKQRYVE